MAYGGPPSTYELALGDIVKIEVAYTQDPNIGGLVRTSASSIVTDHSTDSPHPHILRLNSLAREALYKGIGGIRLGCQFALIPDIIHQYVDSNLDHFGPKYSLLGGVPTSLLLTPLPPNSSPPTLNLDTIFMSGMIFYLETKLFMATPTIDQLFNFTGENYLDYILYRI